MCAIALSASAESAAYPAKNAARSVYVTGCPAEFASCCCAASARSGGVADGVEREPEREPRHDERDAAAERCRSRTRRHKQDGRDRPRGRAGEVGLAAIGERAEQHRSAEHGETPRIVRGLVCRIECRQCELGAGGRCRRSARPHCPQLPQAACRRRLEDHAVVGEQQQRVEFFVSVLRAGRRDSTDCRRRRMAPPHAAMQHRARAERAPRPRRGTSSPFGAASATRSTPQR